MASHEHISPTQLYRLMGTAKCPIIIDCRIDEDISSDPFLVPGSFTHSHLRHESLLPIIANQRAITVCQKGEKLSQGLAAHLRCSGVHTEVLEGGMFAWRDARFPRVPISAIPEKNSTNATIWVTRHRPKIDRVACPWLIRRFVDRQAKFLFVPPRDVEAVAERFGAIPFDIEGVKWSHRGENCTFDTMVEEFELQTEPLMRLAEIIRAADTNQHDTVSEAAGLLALSVGLSRMYRDDLEQLDAGISMYDSLYRWARDGHDETHEWPVNK